MSDRDQPRALDPREQPGNAFPRPSLFLEVALGTAEGNLRHQCAHSLPSFLRLLSCPIGDQAPPL